MIYSDELPHEKPNNLQDIHVFALVNYKSFKDFDPPLWFIQLRCIKIEYCTILNHKYVLHSNLTKLNIFNSSLDITKNVCDALRSCTQLKVLYISVNSNYVSFISSLQKLKQLQKLRFKQYNHVKTFHLCYYHLRVLILINCHFVCPTFLLPNLYLIHLDHSTINNCDKLENKCFFKIINNE